MFKNDPFKNKTVLVTGGGTGIGFAISREYILNGAEVIIASRTQQKLDKAAEELNKMGSCHTFSLDIREVDQVEALAKFIEEKCGKLDILVNNAGGQFTSPAEKIKPKGWNAVINNNLNGTWFMTQIMANSFFIPQNQGSIVNIIANMFRGFPGMAHTGAARAGVDNLTKTLAVEWVRHHIQINSIAPGIIKTDALGQYPPEFLKGVTDTIPQKRLGTPEDIAHLCLFLTSGYACYITGETIYVDGGQRLWGDLWKIK